MSQRSTRKRRPTIQIVCALALVGLIGCAGTPAKKSVHPTSGSEAKTLSHRATIDLVGLGFGDAFKRFFVGSDSHDLKRPVSIGMRDDVMYIFDGGEGYLFKYSLSDGRMSPVWGVGTHITEDVTDIYVSEDHSIYLTDIEGRRVLKLNSDGDLQQIFFDGPNMSRPVAVSVNESNGDVYIADEVYSNIVTFNKEGKPVRGYGGRGTGPGKFRIITDMIKTEDAFYVSDRVELSVQILDLNGRYLTHFGEGQLLFPNSLAVDEHGRVFVAEKMDSTIKVFKQGKLIDVIGKNGYGDGEFRLISDMKIHKGYLYAVDSLNGRIQVFEVLPEAKAEKTALLQ